MHNSIYTKIEIMGGNYFSELLPLPWWDPGRGSSCICSKVW